MVAWHFWMKGWFQSRSTLSHCIQQAWAFAPLLIKHGKGNPPIRSWLMRICVARLCRKIATIKWEELPASCSTWLQNQAFWGYDKTWNQKQLTGHLGHENSGTKLLEIGDFCGKDCSSMSPEIRSKKNRHFMCSSIILCARVVLRATDLHVLLFFWTRISERGPVQLERTPWHCWYGLIPHRNHLAKPKGPQQSQ